MGWVYHLTHSDTDNNLLTNDITMKNNYDLIIKIYTNSEGYINYELYQNEEEEDEIIGGTYTGDYIQEALKLAYELAQEEYERRQNGEYDEVKL